VDFGVTDLSLTLGLIARDPGVSVYRLKSASLNFSKLFSIMVNSFFTDIFFGISLTGISSGCPDSRSLVSTGSDFICTLSNDSVLLSLTCVAFLSGVNRGVGCRDSSLLRSGVNDSRRLLQRSDMELDSLALRSLNTGSLSVNTALTVEFEAAVAAAATLAEASAKSPDDGGDVVCRELADCGGSSAAAAAGANVAGNGRPTGGVFGVGVCADVLLLSLPEQCDSLDGHRPSGAFETELLDSRDWQRGLASSLQ
uniref:Uncharacterized protein n=1 Tax=Glossina palpalis gambiensis TaxID=67801 RepID=A0A1B0BBS0_9MUSC